jgi:hydrogenase maturation protein HypF
MPTLEATRTKAPVVAARHWTVGGRVQGVGFRPFVYRLAWRLSLDGWVMNRGGDVEVLVQGSDEALSAFGAALIEDAPPLAQPRIVGARAAEIESLDGFAIRNSDGAPAHVHVPPDYFACDDCLTELDDPNNRRYRYPFINCTQCGPRYALIARLPYDRQNTAMVDFTLCPQCAAEYADPADRRFHAEPIACPVCGPRLSYRDHDGEAHAEEALAATVAALHAGRIVAVKGIGGYHLMCDAANSAVVTTLRVRKKRPHKPLAVMFARDLIALRRATHLTPRHEEMLSDPLRPIVLVPKRADSNLTPEIAPAVGEIGAMLPYSPLHHLLLGDFGGPLVATSGNISGEPVLTDNDDADRRLGTIADAFLHHDRPILRPVDDPVYRVIAGIARPLRLGRGNAPLERILPFTLKQPVLALGGHLKNTIALGFDDRVVISPHLGDMESPRGLALLRQVATDLQALYGVRAETVLCDAHPRYATTKLAPQFDLPVTKAFHHEAHASALYGETALEDDVLVFTWDGAGFGRDGSIWGGEALLGAPGRWQRVATIRPFALLGGDRAAREPWRNALALCWETGRDWPADERDTGPLRHAWERRLNCPATTSIGRLFDAAAALVGIATDTSYEGQAACEFEAIAMDDAPPIDLPLTRRPDGGLESDWAPLLDDLQNNNESVAARAGRFHATLAAMLLNQARAIRDTHGVTRLGLSGGVFQNRLLCERIIRDATREQFTVLIPEDIPCNDAGLSFGQIVEAGPRR